MGLSKMQDVDSRRELLLVSVQRYLNTSFMGLHNQFIPVILAASAVEIASKMAQIMCVVLSRLRYETDPCTAAFDPCRNQVK